MTERPAVSIVVPFAGDHAAAQRAAAAFAAVRRRAGDELVFADNTHEGVLASDPPAGAIVVRAAAERSSYHARNAGAARAACPWLLFVDADCVPEPGILDAYFATPAQDDEGALAGAVAGDPDQPGLVARYTRSRGYLEQGTLLDDDFRPHAVTANLLVRRRAWESIGGFAEGVRSGGDTEFSWRLHDAGWRIGHRPQARVSHRHRESLRDFVRVTARYAAGRAWLRRRYPGAFAGRPGAVAVARAAGSALRWALTGRRERAAFRAIDALVGAVDLTAERLPNRAPGRSSSFQADLVVLADVFPALSETFIVSELRALQAAGVGVRVESWRRPLRQDLARARGIRVDHAEDDAAVDKLAAVAWLVARHPWRALNDVRARRRWRAEEPVAPLRAIAPAARRLAREPGARLHCHFAAGAALTALRLSALSGRPYSVTAHAYEVFREPRNLLEKLRRADVVTTGCDYNVRYLRGLLGDDGGARVHEIVMGVDGEELVRRVPHPRGRTVIAVGRLVEKKGFTDLLHAMALLAPDAAERLVVVGDGPLAGELERLAASLGVSARVAFLGALDHGRVREELERADVLAMPCVVAADGDRDSMPVVVKEALALELPVVATDEVGLPELVRPEFGRLVPPRDPPALARALEGLLALPPERRAEMGRAGRAWVLEHCDVRVETARLAALLGLADPQSTSIR